jgi:hypothetical protein
VRVWLATALLLASCAAASPAPKVVVTPAPVRANEPLDPCPLPRDTTLLPAIELPGAFTRFAADGSAMQVLAPNAEAPTEVIAIDSTTFATRSRRKLELGVVAFDFDGSVQVVKTSGSFERVNVVKGTREAVPKSLVAPDSEYSRASLSDDGRLFTYEELAVYDLDTRSIAFTFDAPCAGGPNPLVTLTHDGHFAIGFCRGTGLADLRDPHLTHRRWAFIADSFELSSDERFLLEGPYYPFGMDWKPGFVVRELATGKAVKLAMKLPTMAEYRMTICATGAIAAVSYGNTLTFFDAKSGAKTIARELDSHPSARLAFSPRDPILAIGHDATLERVRLEH